MKYKDLQDLISHSSSTRQYFLSLPVSLQLTLHKYNPCIHTAADLHLHADLLRSLPDTFLPDSYNLENHIGKHSIYFKTK